MVKTVNQKAKQPEICTPKAEGAMLKLVVSGDFYARTPKGSEKRGFTNCVCHIPAHRIELVKGLLKGRLLPEKLSKMDPQFAKLRSFKIDDTQLVGEATIGHLGEVDQVRLMNRKQLLSFINSKKLDIEVSLYPQLDKLRQAVQLCMENADFFKIREAEVRESLQLDMELFDLDKDLLEDEDKMEITVTPGVDEPLDFSPKGDNERGESDEDGFEV